MDNILIVILLLILWASCDFWLHGSLLRYGVTEKHVVRFSPAVCVFLFTCIHLYVHRSGITLWPLLHIVLVPKQPWPIKLWTPLDPSRCSVVSGTKMLAADPLSPPWIGLVWTEIWWNPSNPFLCSSNRSWTIFASWQMASWLVPTNCDALCITVCSLSWVFLNDRKSDKMSTVSVHASVTLK